MVYEKDIEILKAALKTKLWRNESGQLAKWVTLIENLCKLYNVKVPSLHVGGRTVIPQYNYRMTAIFLPKYSIISLLHELGHHFGFSERQCKEYSEQVFIAAYKPARNLVRDDRGYLVKTCLK